MHLLRNPVTSLWNPEAPLVQKRRLHRRQGPRFPAVSQRMVMFRVNALPVRRLGPTDQVRWLPYGQNDLFASRFHQETAQVSSELCSLRPVQSDAVRTT